MHGSSFYADIHWTCAPVQELGFGIVATDGTAAHLRAAGVEAQRVLKIQEGRPNASDLMKNGDIAMMLITSTGDEVRGLHHCLFWRPAVSCEALTAVAVPAALLPSVPVVSPRRHEYTAAFSGFPSVL
jgi:hypothetical protein